MHRRKVLFYCSLSVALSAIFLLATGSSLLTLPIGKQVVVPLGNLITWAGIIALPLSAYWGMGALRTPTKRLNSILGGALKALIILAICWFPISFLLAGNLSFNFAGIPSFQGGPICNEVILGIELRPCIGHHIDYLHLLGFAIIATSKKGAALIRHDEAGHFDGFGRDLAFGGLICATKNGVRLQSLLDSLNSFSKTD
jgi:hypothetical protein